MAEFNNLFEIFENIKSHVIENGTYYGVGVAFIIPFIFFTRKYSVPFILYIVEITIYLVIMHTVVTLLTNFFAWLHNQTSMQAVRERAPNVFWDTPWALFWQVESYDPKWIVYMEGIFTVIIFGLVFKYRPMKVQKSRKQSEAVKKGEFQPDQYSNRDRAKELARKYSNQDNAGKGGKGRR